MIAVTVFCILCIFLIIGKVLRVSIPLLQMSYLPSSVIGGLVGLLLFQCFPGIVDQNCVNLISKVPGFMINVVFASLFLGVVTPPLKRVFQLGFPQLCFGQILAWGQYVIGFAIVGFVLIPLYKVNPAFGNLLEIGFQGGHGTVGGMAAAFREYKWEDGIALGYTMATAGMVLGVIVGMALVNWAARKGYVENICSFKTRPRNQQQGIYLVKEAPYAGKQTVYCDSIDSLAWHIALIGLAILIGFGMLKGLQISELKLFPGNTRQLFKAFPLFPLCMLGGLIMQKGAQRFKINSLIDHDQMQRLAGAALDFLVVSAMATIRIEVVAQNWQGLLLLILLGTVFSVVMVVFVAPKLFKEAWFERAIADFGQSLGVTATGLLLLRTVDPESKTAAAQSFGYKQLIHEPFMGGGLWTALALTLLYALGWKIMLAISVGAMLIWIIISIIYAKKQ